MVLGYAPRIFFLIVIIDWNKKILKSLFLKKKKQTSHPSNAVRYANNNIFFLCGVALKCVPLKKKKNPKWKKS